MTIAAIESWILRFPYHKGAADGAWNMVDLVGVFVTIEGGVRGMGFTYAFQRAGTSIKAMIDDVLAPSIVGRALADRARLWDELWWLTRRLGAGISMLALSALDIALWDAAARVARQPLHRFIGSRQDSVPVFASGNYSPALSADALVDNALRDIDRGFDAIKLRTGGRRPEEDLDRLRQVRRAVGGDVRLMADAAELMTLPEAIWIAPRLADIELFWLEEPLPSEDLADYRALQHHCAFPLAMGEHFFNRFQFRDCLESGAAAIVQPDVCLVGGITEYLRIEALASVHGRPLAPHLVTELHVQLAAASSNTVYVEHFPFVDHLFETSLEVSNGRVAVPGNPGHGLDFRPGLFDALRVG